MEKQTAGPGKRRILEVTLGLLAIAVMATSLPAGAAPSEATPAAHPPSLEGTWLLNEDLTARMRETDQQHGTKRGSGGGFGRRGDGGGRRGGGPGNPPIDTTDDPPGPGILEMDPVLPEGPRPSFNALTQVTITQKGQQVTIADSEGHTRVLTTDGSKVKDAKGTGGAAEIRASWDKEGALVVTVRPDKGPKRTESYIVSNDRKHLYIVLAVDGQGSRPEIKIRRAYDPAPPPEKPAAPAESPSEGDSALA